MGRLRTDCTLYRAGMQYLPLVVVAWSALYFQWRVLLLCVLPDGAAMFMLDAPKQGLLCWLLADLPFTCMCPPACEEICSPFIALRRSTGPSAHLDPACLPEGTTCSLHTQKYQKEWQVKTQSANDYKCRPFLHVFDQSVQLKV